MFANSFLYDVQLFNNIKLVLNYLNVEYDICLRPFNYT